MTIDYTAVRNKTNELSRNVIKIVDMLGLIESETTGGEPLTPTQLNSLKTKIKLEVDTLKTIVGEIKNGVNV